VTDKLKKKDQIFIFANVISIIVLIMN